MKRGGRVKTVGPKRSAPPRERRGKTEAKIAACPMRFRKKTQLIKPRRETENSHGRSNNLSSQCGTKTKSTTKRGGEARVM